MQIRHAKSQPTNWACMVSSREPRTLMCIRNLQLRWHVQQDARGRNAGNGCGIELTKSMDLQTSADSGAAEQIRSEFPSNKAIRVVKACVSLAAGRELLYISCTIVACAVHLTAEQGKTILRAGLIHTACALTPQSHETT
eukprot:1158509-Pelagomonas_calceolata.AAC.11